MPPVEDLEHLVDSETMRHFTLTLRTTKPLRFRLWFAMQLFRLAAFVAGTGFKREDVSITQETQSCQNP